MKFKDFKKIAHFLCKIQSFLFSFIVVDEWDEDRYDKVTFQPNFGDSNGRYIANIMRDMLNENLFFGLSATRR